MTAVTHLLATDKVTIGPGFALVGDEWPERLTTLISTVRPAWVILDSLAALSGARPTDRQQQRRRSGRA